MYCPKCGQLQISEEVRFCSRCGFLLEGVQSLLATDGISPHYTPPANRPMSARTKGVRQGAMLMLSTLFIVPVTAIFFVGVLDGPEEIVALAAIFCFIGGFLRMLYALMFENSYPEPDAAAPYAAPGAPQFERTGRNAGLPPASVNSVPTWRPQPNTAELVHRPSVTENTTRLLDKDEPGSR